MEPLRSSSLASLYEYDYRAECSPSRADDKRFELNVIVATTKGRWQFHGRAGRTEMSETSLMVGVADDEYSCRHDRRQPDSNLAVCLAPDAIDPGLTLFSAQVVPAQDALRLMLMASRAETDDAFDSAIFMLFDEASRRSMRHWTIDPPNVRMQRVKRFIELHACEALRLKDIAQEVGLSPFTTLREFRAATGKTPHAYLLELRLQRAQQLLKRSCAPIEAVARDCGFGDFAYFSRFFKRKTGFSPTAYRASALS